MFFTLAKFPFENMLNDNDNDEFIELLSLYYYKRNVLSCCLLIRIIIILIIINYHLLLLLLGCESATSSKQ